MSCVAVAYMKWKEKVDDVVYIPQGLLIYLVVSFDDMKHDDMMYAELVNMGNLTAVQVYVIYVEVLQITL